MAEAFLGFGVREAHESWCAYVRMMETEEMAHAESVEAPSATICHTCDSYPCTCARGTGIYPQRDNEWIYRINGTVVSKEAYDAFTRGEEEPSNWKEAMRMRDMIGTRNGRIL